MSKEKKKVIRDIEKRLMSRLSDYFTCWKLKMLLRRGQSLAQISQSQILDPSECSLDYSVWRNHLERETAGRNRDEAAGMIANTVRVRRIGESRSGNKNEESKVGTGAAP